MDGLDEALKLVETLEEKVEDLVSDDCDYGELEEVYYIVKQLKRELKSLDRVLWGDIDE